MARVSSDMDMYDAIAYVKGPSGEIYAPFM